MANSGPGQNATVEEILASIRRAISEDDAKRTADRQSEAVPPVDRRRPVPDTGGAPFEAGPEPAGATEAIPPESVAEPTQTGPDHATIEHAIEQAIDGVRAELEGKRPQPMRLRPRQVEETALRSQQRAIPRAPRMASIRREVQGTRTALISPRTDARVSASFDELTRAMIEGNARKLDEAVEVLLRPMLKTWLEGNLPQMVERLVREEIERVSRGRR